jgi:hypothetical protein
MLVQSAVKADECEIIIIMSSLCLNKTNTGKKEKGRGGIKTSMQAKRVKLHSHKLVLKIQ